MEILHQLLKKLQELGAEDVVLQNHEEESTLLKFANDKLVNNKSWTLTGTSVFIAYKKRIVTTTLHEQTPSGAEVVAKKIIALAKLSEPNPNYQGIAQGFKTYPPLDELYDAKVKDADLVELYETGLHKAQQLGAKRNSGILQSRVVKANLLTSGGIEGQEEKSYLYYSIRSFTDKDASGHGIATSPYNVDAGFSCLKDKVGQTISSDMVTLWDHGRLKNGFHSTAFDAEGVPSQETCLIKKGVFQTYVHNTSTARQYGVSSTGNAGLLSPDTTNLVVQNGDHTFDELIGEIKQGLYVTNVWYTRFQNYEKGDFSTIPRDGLFYIENGKIKHPVKELRISENLIRILKNVAALGRKREQIYSWEVSVPTTTPHVLVKDCNVAKPTA